MPTRSGRPGPILTYHQRQLAREVATKNRRALNGDLDDLLNTVEERAKGLGQQHKRSTAWILHQLYQGGRLVRQRRAVSVTNAAQQVEGFLKGLKGGA